MALKINRNSLRLAVLLFVLFASSTLPFYPLLTGEYVFDDTVYLRANPDLAAVRSFKDCLSMQLEPGRPVTNFSIALVQYFFPGNLSAQRIASILMHALVVFLLFINLRWISKLFPYAGIDNLPFWVSLLFSIHPIISETIGVAKFRGEILATFFAFGAMALLQTIKKQNSIFKLCILFFLLGMSALSKETFLIIGSIASAIVICHLPDSKGRKQLLGFVVVTTLFWALTIFLLVNQSVPYQYSYENRIGLGVFGVSKQIQISTRALLEGTVKLFTGQGLAAERLELRGGMGHNLQLIPCAIILGIALCVLIYLATRNRWLRVWVSLFAISTLVYLLVPNINIGSERYLYFATAPFLAIVLFLLSRLYGKLKISVSRVTAVTGVCYTIYLLLSLELRLFDYRSRLHFQAAEVESHPESAAAWIHLAGAVMDVEGPAVALAFYRKAKSLTSNPHLFLTFEMEYFFKTHDLAQLEAKLEESYRFRFADRTRGHFQELVAILKFNSGRCDGAEAAYLKALRWDPGNRALIKNYEKFLTLREDKNSCKPRKLVASSCIR